MPDTRIFSPQLTNDGSFTFFCEEIGEAFHSTQGAKQEAQLKFVEPCQLATKAQQPLLRILDVCYGLGYNSASALERIWGSNPHCSVELIALELNPTVPRAAIAYDLLRGWKQPIPELLAELATSGTVETQYFQAQLLLGDARTTIKQLLALAFQAEAIFLDPFSPPRCPQLWTVEFIQQLASCCSTTGKIATYSCAAAVRRALLVSGLQISENLQVGNRQPGTVASFSAADLEPLSRRSQEHLQTRAAVPYRDPQLSDPAPVILHRRRLEQAASSLEPTSQWKKRWVKKEY